MLMFSTATSSQIRFLLQSLTESNAESVLKELYEYIDCGTEGSFILLRTCLDYFTSHGTDLENPLLRIVISSVFKHLLDRPNFSTIFCESLKGRDINQVILENISNLLNLSMCERIGVGLAISDSENLDARMCGKNFCISQIEKLCANAVSVDSTQQIQDIIMFLQRSEGLSKHLDSFMQMLSFVQLKDVTEFVLSPLLSDELREEKFLRNVNLSQESIDHDFDSILAEMEKEMSMGDIMKELGYGCTVNATQCKEILSLFLPLTEITISKILGMIVRNHTGLEDSRNIYTTFSLALGCSTLSDLPSLNSWDVDVLIDTVKQLAPSVDWIRVMENLDHEGFYIPNEEAFSFFMSVYRRACQEAFPLHTICGSVWKNMEGQISFLKHAVFAPPEIFTFAHSGRQLAYIDGVHGHKLQLGHTNHTWTCLDLLNILCELAERGHARSVQSILEFPLKNWPELLLFGMAHINTAYNLLQYEVSFSVFPLMLRNPLGSGLILQLWHVNPNLVLRGFVDSQNSDPDCIVRILDICQELKILLSVLDMIPYSCGLRLAAIASRKEFLDLEKWLSNSLNSYKDAFFEECLKFLKEIHYGGSQDFSTKPFYPSNAFSNIYLETASTFLKVLRSNVGTITSTQLSEEMEKLHGALQESNRKLHNGGASDVPATEGYAEDIEAEANSYFQQMFSGQLTIEVMVQMLARFKESSVKREQSIFDCMIANLFEEYRFFPKYPERQLKIAAVLFGSVIKHQLVTHLTLGIALRGVLDALRKPADSKMFVFGTKAVEQFVDRLIEWPQYCNHILQISHLRTSHMELVAFIEQALLKISAGHSDSDATSGNVELNSSSNIQASQQHSSGAQLQQKHENAIDDQLKVTGPSVIDGKPILSTVGQTSIQPIGGASTIQKVQNTINNPTVLSSSGFVRPPRVAASTRFGSALNIETLVAAAEKRETPIEAPASDVQDKISFMINNISLANYEVKAKEITEILKEQFYPWFAQYMVMKRASIEQNFHDLYLKFIDSVNSKALSKEIVQASYENCKVLLGSELIKSSSEERSLLKNLGSWLGKLTIGRNQVLRAREIDPKSLIIEAYEKGLMIAVIPFTSKVLEPCQSSLAYQPPNPWTMGILGLLAEIYSMPNLKMNLKFDIEVLFKTLSVDVKEITPTSLLKDRKREIEGNPDFSNKDVGASQPQMVAEMKSNIMSSLNQVELPLEVATASNSGNHSHLLSQYAAPLHLSSGTLMEDEKLAVLGLSDQVPTAQGLLQATPTPSPFSTNQLPAGIPNIGSLVVINQKLNSLGLHIHFQRAVPIAMDRAVKEIVSGIVQRSVSIATQTTKELVLKDYAMESDETRIFNAAHLMVASLAGCLAHVTCKEPLRGSISSQLRSSLQGLGVASDLLEQAVQLVTNDNLDLGCAIIEQAATDKAIQTIDGEISQQLSLRRKHREGVNPTFYDTGMYAQGPLGVVPEALRPKPGHLSVSQQRVYEDFVRLPLQNQNSQAAQSAGSSITVSGTGLSSQFGLSSGQLNSGYTSGLVTGLEGVSRALEESGEPTSVPQLSATPGHIAADGVGVRGSENDLDDGSFPSAASTPELHAVDTSDTVNEPGSSSQPSPSPITTDRHATTMSEPSLTTRDALDKFQVISQKLEALVSNEARETEFQGVIAEVPEIILRCISRDEAALAVAQKVFKVLYDNASNSFHVGALLAILIAIRDVCKLVVKELTSWVIYSEEERKYNKDITLGLIRSELINLAEYNVHMAKLIDGGRNKAATEFAISLLQTLVVEESSVISELHNLVDALAKVAAKPGSPEPLQQLVEIIKNPAASTASMSGVNVGREDKARLSRDKKAPGHVIASKEDSSILESEDPAGFRDQVSILFAEWYRICELPGGNEAAFNHFILQLHQNGLLKGDDVADRFFRLLTEISVAHCLSSEVINSGALQSPQQTQNLSFLAIDIYAKLVFSILKGSGKTALLSRILAVTVRFIQRDAEEKKASFNPRPYFRLFINWLPDLGSLEPIVDGANFQILTAFANAFHALHPLKIPAFSYAWLELVSHRSFMPKMLTGNSQKGWPYIQRLLVDMFQFMEPFLRNAELGPPVHFLYKGTLRVLLVLLHDFPEFLCDYHFTFCDMIPPSCIQMRNIILSAFPRNMRLPDPSTPNLKIDLLAEINQSPRILSEVDGALKSKQMKADVDEYLKTRQQGSSFLAGLKQKLLLPPSEAASAGTRYNVPLINSLVLYVGMQAIQQLQARSPHAQSTANTVTLAVFLVGAALDIFQTLIVELDTEGRYLFLNAVANQLRYPNTHTHYFSFVLLYLFAESTQEIIQEQITRVLLERLIVNRPHPWGLLITFIELIKNPRYNFWNRSFIRCAPDIERLFESVSRSCGGPKSADENMIQNWVPDTAH
ncbi:CCR4-NOT transcription complex subunit 1-like isoform X1 [Cucurbita moschata]|uniref:CCR4-NOT transcription complex subunit 1-like isoform X1 n=2 Tax=Cucurbita TaxID=3660 RepID=A0A6J1FZ37_CUCMO|nr:CCR4-NOT transcription complex subunit 1-like isoform X1 [Cucurbita moschata]